MDSIDGTNGMDSMDTIEFDQPDAGGAADRSRGPRWTGRTKRVVTSVAASTVLLGSGAAIGVALTGGASASTSGTTPGMTANSTGTTTAASVAVGRCAKLAQRLQSHDHPLAATRLLTFCKNPLLRLALVGGEHGEVTFQTAAGPKTIAVERGTVQAISSSGITVQAKDGTTWTWEFTPNTAVRKDHQKVSQNSLSTGEMVLVAGPVVGGVRDVRLIRVRDDAR